MARLEAERAAAGTQMSSLPEECVREILLRLSDADDLDRAGGTCSTMSLIVTEKRIWRELVQTHFTKSQIEMIITEKPHLKENKNWRELYHCLKRKFGLRDEFTELVMLCKLCRSIYRIQIYQSNTVSYMF